MDGQYFLLGHQEGWNMLSHPVILRQQGFTLVELMIAVAVLGILLSVGVPSFKAWLLNTKIRTTAEAMQNGLQLARAEAVRRNERVRFVISGAQAGLCKPTLAPRSKPAQVVKDHQV